MAWTDHTTDVWLKKRGPLDGRSLSFKRYEPKVPMMRRRRMETADEQLDRMVAEHQADAER